MIRTADDIMRVLRGMQRGTLKYKGDLLWEASCRPGLGPRLRIMAPTPEDALTKLVSECVGRGFEKYGQLI